MRFRSILGSGFARGIGSAIGGALLATSAAGAQSLLTPLQPATYSSPSGEFELTVDPLTWSGMKGADYRLTHRGEAVWSGVRPFSFRGAVVNDQGCVGGFGFRDSAQRSSEYYGNVFFVAILAPDGSLLREEREERSYRDRTVLCPRPDPVPDPVGSFLHPDLDRFVVRVRDGLPDNWNEEWRIYRLSTGQALDRVRPKDRLAIREAVGRAEVCLAIPGTPLTLVSWRIRSPSDDENPGACVVLLDQDWNAVWTHERLCHTALGLPAIQGDRAQNLRPIDPITSAMPSGAFFVRTLASDLDVSYRATPSSSAPGTWQVTEIEQREHLAAVDPAVKIEELYLTEIVSKPLSIELRGSSKVNDASIDPLGRIFVTLGLPDQVHQYSADGDFVGILEPGPLRGSMLAAVRGTARGDILLVGGLMSRGRRYGPDRQFRAEIAGAFVAASGATDAEDYWAGTWRSLVRRHAATDDILEQIDRRPDGRWFRKLAAIAMGPDGSLVALDQESDSGKAAALAIYSGDGAPVKCLALPEIAWLSDLACGERWIAVEDSGTNAAMLLVRREDDALFRFVAPPLAEGQRWSGFAFSPDSLELWWIELPLVRLHRFALP